jgi:hypothetical protein
MRYNICWSSAWPRLLLAVTTVGAISSQGWTQITGSLDLGKEVFKKQNIARLCIEEGNRPVVSRRALAWYLMSLNVPFDTLNDQEKLLRYATSDGSTVDEPGDEQVIHFVSSGNPFGINRAPPEDLRKAMQTAAKRQRPVLTALWDWLQEGHKYNTSFQLDGPTNSTDPEEFFQKGSKFRIVCKPRRPSGENQPSGEVGGGGSGDWLKNVIVRKGVGDIAVQSNNLKKAQGAQFSYQDDMLKDKTTVSVEGLVGVAIAGTGADRAEKFASADAARDLYWYRVVPYVYYKSKSTRPLSKTGKDIDYVIPGVTGNFTVINAANTFSYDLQVEGSNTIDNELTSSVYNLGLRFSPSFYDGRTVYLGAAIGLPGTPLSVRPDLALVARQYAIEDAGKNPELKNQRSYTGLGFDATTQIYIDVPGSIISNFVGKVGYTYRYNTNDVVDVMRFNTGLSYVINTNLTVDLDYVDGRDPNTLQDEQQWTLSLSFRN